MQNEGAVLESDILPNLRTSAMVCCLVLSIFIAPANFETCMKPLFVAILATCTIYSTTLTAQLLPLIGVNTEPLASAPMCDIPTYLGSFDQSGYEEGALVNDFSLFSPEGERYQLQDILGLDKPVLLVSANYTCWRFRDQIEAINAITTYYADEISVFYVYTVEAHPHISLSPYSGTVWTGTRNFTDYVLYEQPTTYGERLDIIGDLREEFGIVPTVLVDDPCNQWWSHYGPAPNNAYFIGTDGKVIFKHPWANNPPYDLWCDISNYLHDDNENCNDAGFDGSFDVSFDTSGDNTVYGSPGDVLTVPTTITNLSQTDNVVVDITRQNVYVQPDWQTALCVNVCYNWTVDQASVTIPPGAEQSFTFYFYSGTSPGTGSGEVLFQNAFAPSNGQVLEFNAVTGITTGMREKASDWSVFPNPATEQITINFTRDRTGETLIVSDMRGRSVLREPISATAHTVQVSGLPAGLYLIRVGDAVRRVVVNSSLTAR